MCLIIPRNTQSFTVWERNFCTHLYSVTEKNTKIFLFYTKKLSNSIFIKQKFVSHLPAFKIKALHLWSKLKLFNQLTLQPPSWTLTKIKNNWFTVYIQTVISLLAPSFSRFHLISFLDSSVLRDYDWELVSAHMTYNFFTKKLIFLIIHAISLPFNWQ